MSKFWSKIEMLIENNNFGQKSKFCSKIQILFKNPNFVQKFKFCSKIQILVKNSNTGGHLNPVDLNVEFGKFCDSGYLNQLLK